MKEQEGDICIYCVLERRRQLVSPTLSSGKRKEEGPSPLMDPCHITSRRLSRLFVLAPASSSSIGPPLSLFVDDSRWRQEGSNPRRGKINLVNWRNFCHMFCQDCGKSNPRQAERNGTHNRTKMGLGFDLLP